MNHGLFSNDNVIDTERRIRQLKDRIERLERGGSDANEALVELQTLLSDLSRAA